MDFAPITYVGLLVDLLQEWDRHAVYRGRQLLVPRPSPPRLPVQSVDLTLKAPRGGAPAVLGYRTLDPAALGQLEQDLDSALEGWRDLARVTGA